MDKILPLMQEMFKDSVYATAKVVDNDATDEAVQRAEQNYAAEPIAKAYPNPFEDILPKSEYTYEQLFALDLHKALYDIVRRSWVRSFSRDEMVQLLTLLAKGEQGLIMSSLRFCGNNEAYTVQELRDLWNKYNPEQEIYSSSDWLP